ncbi:MAG: nhaA3, partial [Myxococcales bacterium]|nr:nhaA3 [Myxococcales bacterium]
MSKASAIIATTLALVVGCFLGRKLASSTPTVAVHHGAPPAADVERYKIPIDGAPARGGDAGAKVTIVEFSDFECPFCSRIEPTLTELLARYGKELRVVWKDFPLAQHRSAQAAAVAARAAAARGKFWPMHDKLFANQRDVTTGGRDTIVRLARDNGVDVDKLLDDAALKALVQKDLEDARRFAVNATPSLYVNGRPVRGRLTADALAPMIEEELANADRALAAGAAPRDLYAALTA